MGELTHEEAHRIAREKGVNIVLYRLMQLILTPLFRLVFALRTGGVKNVPATGSALLVPNHKSFFDSFFIAAVLRRPIRNMGKSELFRGRHGRLYLALGGFPVKRGESDAEAMETAAAILRRGDLLTIYPEGTRVADPDALGTPKRGAARLAIETNSPLIPIAITGTEKRRFPTPRKVQITFGEPIPVDELAATPETAGELTDNVVWPQIQDEYQRLRARPGLVAAGAAAVGLAVLVQRRRR